MGFAVWQVGDCEIFIPVSLHPSPFFPCVGVGFFSSSFVLCSCIFFIFLVIFFVINLFREKGQGQQHTVGKLICVDGPCLILIICRSRKSLPLAGYFIQMKSYFFSLCSCSAEKSIIELFLIFHHPVLGCPHPPYERACYYRGHPDSLGPPPSPVAGDRAASGSFCQSVCY